jgi:hypothetical protein
VLQVNAVLNAISTPVGHSVTLSATGLAVGTPYSVVFNYAVNSNGNTFTGPVVGSLTTDTNGQGSSNFVVPAGTQSGSYVVQLVTPGATLPTQAWLVNPPTLSVTSGGVGPGTSCNSTQCFGLSGTASQATQGAYQVVQVSYTNTSNAPVQAVVFAVIHNSIGQTVSIATASLTVGVGATGIAYPTLFGLPSGTYSVTLFVTSQAGAAISTTSTLTVTL